MPFYNNIKSLLEAKLSVQQFKELHNTLNINPIWLGRRISRPGDFTLDEMKVLSRLTDTPLSVLLDDYGLGKDTLSINEADAIRNETLTAASAATEPAVAVKVRTKTARP